MTEKTAPTNAPTTVIHFIQCSLLSLFLLLPSYSASSTNFFEPQHRLQLYRFRRLAAWIRVYDHDRPRSRDSAVARSDRLRNRLCGSTRNHGNTRILNGGTRGSRRKILPCTGPRSRLPASSDRSRNPCGRCRWSTVFSGPGTLWPS